MPGRSRKDTVSVDGLKEFQKALRDMDKSLGKSLRAALNAASTFLITQARPLIPKRSGNAAQSLKARSSQTSVRVVVGGRKAPYYPWLDFGGRVGPAGGVRRPFIADGRYLYPTLRDGRAEFERLLGEELEKLAESVGLDLD